MIKKVHVDKLKPGIYISDINCDWMNHPFLQNHVLVKSDEMVSRIKGYGIREVFIDTSRGLDIDDAPTAEEAIKNSENKLNRVLSTDPEFDKSESLRSEMLKAKKIKEEAFTVVQKFSDDLRLGKKLNLDGVDHVVDNLVESISRNKDALLTLISFRGKDQYTFMHSVSVGVLTIALCKGLGLDSDTIRKFGLGALLHDVGKMMVPLELINKPGKLTEEEFDQIKKHAAFSREILIETGGIPEEAVQIAFEHHERFDGKGYPQGLEGNEISLGGQMTSIVDVYDAITSVRSYSNGIEPIEALRRMFEWSKYHFNEELVHKFIKTMGIYPVGSLVRLANNQLAIVIETGKDNLLKPVVRIIYDIKRGLMLSPRDIDLSQGVTGAHHIQSSEIPADWNIDPAEFLKLSLAV